MVRTSRISRWTGKDEPETRASRTSPRQLATAATSVRIEAAARSASAALGSARARLDAVRSVRRGSAALVAVAGTVGLVGLDTLLVVGAPQIDTTVIGLFALAAAIPILTSLRRSWVRDLPEANAVAAVEHARTVVMQAAFLKDLLAQPQGLRPSLQDAVLASIEQAAAVVAGREHRSTMVPGEHARRHVRIKPTKTRIVITRSDQLAVLAELIDVSISGAAIRGDLPDLSAGDDILVGSRPARVVRLLPGGLACEFITLLAPELLDFDIEL